jgi:hypothetical protein
MRTTLAILAILAAAAAAYGQPPLTPTIDGRQLILTPGTAICRWEVFGDRIRLTVVEGTELRDYWLSLALTADPGPIVPPGPVVPPVTPPGPVTPPVEPPPKPDPPQPPAVKATSALLLAETGEMTPQLFALEQSIRQDKSLSPKVQILDPDAKTTDNKPVPKVQAALTYLGAKPLPRVLYLDSAGGFVGDDPIDVGTLSKLREALK